MNISHKDPQNRRNFHLRTWASISLLVASCAVAFIPENPEASRTVVSTHIDEWTLIENGDAAFDPLEAKIREQLQRSLEQDLPNIPHTDQVNDLILGSLRMLATGKSKAFLSYMDTTGATLKSAQVEASHVDFTRWGFIEPVDSVEQNPTTADLYEQLLAGSRKSGMALAAIDISSLRVGVGLQVQLGSEEWPQRGIRSQSSHFVPPSGVPRQAEQQSSEDNGRAAHCVLRVKFKDGRTGNLLLSVFFDQGAAYWVPATLSIGLDRSEEQWPFPNW